MIPDIKAIAEECGGAKPTQGGYSCNCPGHTDKKKSAKVWLTPDNTVGIYCYSQCGEGKHLYDALRSKSLAFREFDDWQKEEYKKKKGSAKKKNHKEEAKGPPKPKTMEQWYWCAENVFEPRAKPYKKEWPYRDENGVELYREWRYDYVDGSGKEVIPLVPVGDEKPQKYLANMGGIERVLYRLPEVIEYARDERVIAFVEGGKCCDVFEEWGMLATTVAGGSKQPLTKKMIAYLKGCAFVVMIPDLDKPGMIAAHKRATLMHENGIRVKWLELQGLGRIQDNHGPDIFDWREKGGTADQYKEIATSLPFWSPEKTMIWDDSKLPKPDGFENAPHMSPFTDTAQSIRIVKYNEDKMLFVPQSDRHRPWWLYNNKYWENDANRRIILIAQESAHRMYKELAKTSVDQKDLKDFYDSCLNQGGLNAAINLAAPHCGWDIRAFDPNPDHICTLSGVIDLRTGELYEHDPMFFCSKIIPVEWRGIDYESRGNEWREFHKWAYNGDDLVIKFMRRWRGYCLTGHTTEQKFALYYGKEGANGKSIEIENQLRGSGTYGSPGSRDLIMVRQQATKEGNYSQLVGVRLLTVDEIGKRDRFDDSKMRALTGEDKLTGSNLYAAPFSFYPQTKIVMRGNEKPYLEGGDANEASWRRFMFIEFKNTMPKANRRKGYGLYLWDTYQEEMLADNVRGAMEWYQSGLGIPDSVESDTEELRKEFDLFGDFLRWLCVRGEGLEVEMAEFIEAYAMYCRKLRHAEWSANRVGREITARGIGRGRIGDAPAYEGVKLKENWRNMLEPGQPNMSRYSSGPRQGYLFN